ncbi:MAG: hypothetical protein J1G01_06025 [Clostridiales bacterium]|nr:hypothetical protein [Clostridiales bacterium]
MDDKKKIYTQADFNSYAEALKKECEQTLLRQRERIDELRKSLNDAERKIAEYEGQKELVYKAITAALKKADDIERVSLIRYNQEIAQLKSFHDKWMSYYNKIIEAYPLDDDLVAASRASAKISEVLEKAGDIERQYNAERERLALSLQNDESEEVKKTVKDLGTKSAAAAQTRDEFYADRSPAGFSFAEALHPKDDLKDIMKELGVLMDE